MHENQQPRQKPEEEKKNSDLFWQEVKYEEEKHESER